jgi:predicted O-linked N-acetylglucosamine transferase (SPINDLY family)
VLARGGGYIQRNLESLATKRGVDAARIEFCEKRPRPQYLELFSRVDIALDPFPFTGHTTTCDAVWMGLPVVMLAGASYASRFGGSVLRNVGLADLIADTSEGYIDAACRLASDSESLDRLRADLRLRMSASPLLDAAGFTRNLEGAYQDMWRKWCAS